MFEVLYEDNHLFVANKPADLLTQPSGTELPSLEAACKAWLKERHQKPGNVFLEAVHRLDRPVSGVVLFAKTSKALSRLQESMREKQTKKIYTAIAERKPAENAGVLEHYLAHDDFRAKIAKDGKLARLSYRVVKSSGKYPVLEIELETGRYHQIRAQLSAVGCPILGDIKYGAVEHWAYPGIALHHRFLQIPHPISKDMMTFEAPCPWIDLC